MTGDMRRGVLSLCLLCLLAGIIAEPQCVVLTPGLLKSGESGKACLIIKHHTEPINVNISIEVSGTNIPIFQEQIPPGDTFKCSEFQVPKQEKASPVFLLVKAISGSFNFTNRQPLVIAPTGNPVIIRSDKHLYRAGQTAHIHILEIDNNLKPVEGKFQLIYITDPKGNRLTEWRDQSTNGDFLQLNFTFPDHPALGSYQITAERQSGQSVSHSIVAENYDLPRFSVMVDAPKAVTILDKNVAVEVSGRYTFDQFVPGKVSGRLCRPPTYYYVGDPCSRNPDGLCVSFTGEINSEGLYKGSIDVAPLQFERTGYNNYLRLETTLIEEGSGVQITETQIISITTMLGRAYFVDKSMSQYFKRNISYPVEIRVEDGLGQPQSNKTVELQVNGKTVQNLTSDQNGKARCEIDTSEFGTSEIQLQLIYTNAPQCYDSNWVVPNYGNDYRTIRRFFSPSQTFIQLQSPSEDLQCGATYNIKVNYVFGKDALENGETTTKFYFMALSRAQIVDSGEHLVDLSTSHQGEFTLTYTVSPDHATTVHYIVLTMLKNELVADTTQLNLEKCFKNQVSVNFSSEMGTPGSNVDVEVKATPKSVCITRLFDSSLLLMDQGQTLTADRVYSYLQYLTLGGFYYEGYDVAPPQPPCIKADEEIVYNNMYFKATSFPLEGDARKLLTALGLLALTETPFQQPQLCSQPISPRPPIFGRPGPVMDGMAFAEASFGMTSTATVTADIPSEASEIVTYRKNFAEIWSLQRIDTGESGSALQSHVVPDTITTWKGDAICLSNQTGFGMSKYPANYTSFLKLFVDLSFSKSIVRGETMVLKASVANYMDKCAKVQVRLDPSADYTAEAVGGLPVKCICSKKRASYTWNINATSLGVLSINVTAETLHIGDLCDGPPDPKEPNRTDIIMQTFIVEAEGIKQDVTKTNFVCPKGNNPEVVVDINPSGSIVPGTLKATLNVFGNVLGQALVSPQVLFVEPTGCGEQNLAKLMPIIEVLKYLNETGGLTEEMKEKGILNIRKGYMTQLTYRNFDGSFSPFNSEMSSGSSWLTLLSLQTITRCKPYIPVDERVIQQGIVYLSSLQDLNTGSLKPKGMLFNQALRGGADDNIGFSSLVVSFLLETPSTLSATVVRSALPFLEEASRKEQSVYNTILLLLLFKMAGNKELANALSEKVKAFAINDGGTIYWEPLSKPKQPTPFLFSPPATSGAVEMTALALKAFLYGKTASTISEEELTYGSQIALWIAGQQGKHGSYGTTSDTVPALEAMTLYAKLIIQKNATNTVQLKKGNEVIREFKLDPLNRNLLQTEPLQNLPGQYSMVVSGNGCVLLQTGVEFNVPVNQGSPAFLLSVTTSPKDCQNGVATRFEIQVNASYVGSQNKSNMAITDIPLPSGYSVAYSSMSKLRNQFPKVETEKNHLIIYHSEMTSEGVSFSITLEMGAIVINFQDQTAKLYDYYVREENVFAVVRHPCTLKAVPQ